PKDYALGETVGESYAKGRTEIGPKYIFEEGEKRIWWWDTAESVIYFGDPELRVFVPSTEYSDNNYWEKEDVQPIRYDEELTINGHMPFGATDYPNEKEPKTILSEYSIVIIALIAIFVLLIALFIVGRKK
ncbi:MAG: hypothetical protein U9O49_02550, partial [Candidatus Thermoplasmatota archaeon]|nr:hypothetical protein [Candidatus Thermoplasmatota archaeon]